MLASRDYNYFLKFSEVINNQMDFSVMNKIMMYFHGDTYILLASLSCKFLAIAGDNDDDAWAGARQLSGKREPAPGTRSQVRQG